MTEAEWLTGEDPSAMVAIMPSPPNVRKLALFAVAACRADADLMRDRFKGYVSSRDYIEWSEQFIENGLAGQSDSPSHGECFLMTTLVNRCVALASAAVEGQSKYAIGATLDLVEEYLDQDDARKLLVSLLRDIFANPFRPVSFDPRWRSSTATGIAQAIYDDRAFDRLPILADALQDAGCEDADVLAHCRGVGPHVRGCWVVDLVLGKG